MSPQVTVVVAIDSANVEHFHTVIHNWRVYHPEIWELPMVVLYCVDEIDIPVETLSLLDHKKCKWIPWPMFPDGDFEDRYHQLESAALIGISYCVDTKWFLTIQPDTYCTRPAPLIEQEWAEIETWSGYYSPRGYEVVWPHILFGATKWARNAASLLTSNSIPVKQKRLMSYLAGIEKPVVLPTKIKRPWNRVSNLGKLKVEIVKSLEQ